ncbi:hypothetical protein HYW17_04195 [Candidatus Uhrbacteria bacterium]|nr:hypothetical protein [Candidatus Uhrbacteria bacterium]
MYHELITEKSWRMLQDLKRQHQFILIGGWAVYLYTKQLKSKDIDVIVAYGELERLRKEHELFKNDRLKKYEIHLEEIDVDVYVPYFSDLGLPIETVQKHTAQVEGFTLPRKAVLLILKQHAWHDRGHSLKGEKDRVDIIGLLNTGIDWSLYAKLVKAHNLTSHTERLRELLQKTIEVPELNLNAHQFSRLKRKILAQLP